MAQEKIDIEIVIEMLIDGQGYRAIADHFEVSLATLHRFTVKHSARVKEAREISASTYDDKAEEVLRDESIDFGRAREIAQLYKWRASKRKPREYGDRIDVTSDNEKLTNSFDNLTYEQLKELKRTNKP